MPALVLHTAQQMGVAPGVQNYRAKTSQMRIKIGFGKVDTRELLASWPETLLGSATLHSVNQNYTRCV